ncbi:MAG: hypothetical protein AAB906_04215 [Patescibacteria group bacterium]
MDNEKRSFWKKIKNNKKIAIIIVSGLIIGASATVYGAAQTDSWNIGDGWMFFKAASNSEVRANTSDPVDAKNVATKGYVDAATGGGGIAKFTAYGVASCPVGFTTAYTGILYHTSGTTEEANSSNRDFTFCGGDERITPRQDGATYGQMEGSRWWIPVANWNLFDSYMKCAVCVR